MKLEARTKFGKMHTFNIVFAWMVADTLKTIHLEDGDTITGYTLKRSNGVTDDHLN